MVRLEVRDTGVGMAAEDLSRIYDEFYQIGVSPNASRDGYGLGLSIVSRIVKLLGLHLDVQSTPGKGSIFALQLPAAEAAKNAMADATAAGTAGSAAQRAGKHILLVEDDAGVRNATRLLLKAEGYQVAVSSSVAEAVQQARAMPAIDLILSDYHLAGGETGVQAVRAVRELRNRTIRAVMMSGDTSSAIKALGPDQDFHIVSKPIDSEALLHIVGELLFR
jgi:CheY-like chemotaxis protein